MYNILTPPNRPCGMKCCFPGCPSKRKDSDILSPRSYFSFPKDNSRCLIWLNNCKCDHLKTIDPVILNRKYRLCSLHFEDKMFGNYQKNRLKPDAVPTLFSNLVEANLNVEQSLVMPDDSLFTCDNTPSCSTSITDTVNLDHPYGMHTVIEVNGNPIVEKNELELLPDPAKDLIHTSKAIFGVQKSTEMMYIDTVNLDHPYGMHTVIEVNGNPIVEKNELELLPDPAKDLIHTSTAIFGVQRSTEII